MFNLFIVIINNKSYIGLLSLINIISNLFSIKYFNYKLINKVLIEYKGININFIIQVINILTITYY